MEGLIVGTCVTALCCAAVPEGAPDPAAPSSAPAPIEIFVAPTGDDGGPGTAERPLHTLEAARDALRKCFATEPARRPATVWIRGGLQLPLEMRGRIP